MLIGARLGGKLRLLFPLSILGSVLVSIPLLGRAALHPRPIASRSSLQKSSASFSWSRFVCVIFNPGSGLGDLFAQPYLPEQVYLPIPWALFLHRAQASRCCSRSVASAPAYMAVLVWQPKAGSRAAQAL